MKRWLVFLQMLFLMVSQFGCSRTSTVTVTNEVVTETASSELSVLVLEDLGIEDAEEENFVTYLGNHLQQYCSGVDLKTITAEFRANGSFKHGSLPGGDYDYVVLALGSGVGCVDTLEANNNKLTEAYLKVLERVNRKYEDAVIVCIYDMYVMDYGDRIEAAIDTFMQREGASRTVCALDMNDYDDYLNRSDLAEVHSYVGEYLARQINGLESLAQARYGELDWDLPVIALTFDDGPNTTTTNDILDVLEEYEVQASFFLIGKNISGATEAVIQREVALGCEVNSHSYAHDYMNAMTDEEIQSDMALCESLIVATSGVYPCFFRPPYLAVSETMYRNINLPFISGYDCNDWEESVSTEERVQKVLGNAKDGEIILLHDAAGNTQTVEALPQIIEGLREEGYQFVTCTQLFAIKNIIPTTNHLYSVAAE